MTALADRPRATRAKNESRERRQQNVGPIVAAVDGSAAGRAAIGEAVRLAGELGAPIAFVHVRRGPAGFFGAPDYQRRLTKEMARARRVLVQALAAANRAGVQAEGEILEGSPRRRITEFARDRGARLIVVGSRGRKFRQSVSTGVIRAAGRPVIVARSTPQVAAAAQATRSPHSRQGGRQARTSGVRRGVRPTRRSRRHDKTGRRHERVRRTTQ